MFLSFKSKPLPEVKIVEKFVFDSRILVEHILDRSIEWIDWQQMPIEGRREWYKQAQMILNSRVFQSLVGKSDPKTNGEIVKNIIEHIARHSENFDQVRDLRMTINGLELVRDYLEDIPNPDSVTSTRKNLHASI